MLSPSLVLSSRAGFIRHDFYIATPRRQLRSGTLGFPSSFTSQLERQTFPQIQWDGYTTFGSTFGGNNGSIFTIERHVVVVGGAEQDRRQPLVQVRRRVARDGQQPAEPDLVDRPLHLQSRLHAGATRWRADADSGSSVASLLLGYPADSSTTANPSVVADLSRSSTTAATTPACSSRTTGASTPRLTVNAGLRWDYESPIVEDLNQQNIGFDTTSTSPFQAPGLSLRGGLLFASDGQPPAVQEAT